MRLNDALFLVIAWFKHLKNNWFSGFQYDDNVHARSSAFN